MSKPITQVYEKYVSYSNDAERGDELHRVLYTARRIPENFLTQDELSFYRCSVSEEFGYTYYRLYPIN